MSMDSSSPESDSYRRTRRYIRMGVPFIRQADDAQARLKQIFGVPAVEGMWRGICSCSWEVAMKQNISFP
jgi:hypothetical protein